MCVCMYVASKLETDEIKTNIQQCPFNSVQVKIRGGRNKNDYKGKDLWRRWILIVASVSSVGDGRLLTRQNPVIFTLSRWPNEVTASRYRPFSVNSRFYPRDAMLARVIEIATCLSVRHAPVLCQNEES